MGAVENLDARARAMRAVFEQTRQKQRPQRPTVKRRVDESGTGWNTSVGPQAMRAVFEQIPRGSAAKHRVDESRFGWNTSVGPQAMRAIFERVFDPAGQEEQPSAKGKTEQEPLLGQHAQSRIQSGAPRRQGSALKGRHASIIDELIKAHRLF